MKKNMKRMMGWIFTAVLICCIGFTTKGVTADAAIVSGGKKNYSYSELQKDLQQLKKKYKNHCQVNVIGKSEDKRNLYEVVIGNPDAKKHLLVMGNLHAREHMTVQLCMKQIEYYLSNYNKKISGKKISQRGFNAIRNKKLRSSLRKMGGSSSRWKANARGVDLNRNWNVAFKTSGRKGSSGYCGPKAESESETRALVNWSNRIQKQGKIVGIVSYHSTGSIIYGKSTSRAPKAVRNATTRMYQTAKSLTGYQLVQHESYALPHGYSRTYYLYKKKIPFITVEVGRGAAPLGGGEFGSIWAKNKNVVIREAQLFQ